MDQLELYSLNMTRCLSDGSFWKRWNSHFKLRELVPNPSDYRYSYHNNDICVYSKYFGYLPSGLCEIRHGWSYLRCHLYMGELINKSIVKFYIFNATFGQLKCSVYKDLDLMLINSGSHYGSNSFIYFIS